MTTRKGTAVTSWNTDMASPRRPCGLFSSPCSPNWLAMIVVDDCAKTAPTTNAAAITGSPASHPMPKTTAGRQRHLRGAQPEHLVPQRVQSAAARS
jgi:hypothetical protein